MLINTEFRTGKFWTLACTWSASAVPFAGTSAGREAIDLTIVRYLLIALSMTLQFLTFDTKLKGPVLSSSTRFDFCQYCGSGQTETGPGCWPWMVGIARLKVQWISLGWRLVAPNSTAPLGHLLLEGI